MKKRLLIALILFFLLSTITITQNINIPKFRIKEIYIENNIILKKDEIKKSLNLIYDKNILFLKNSEIETKLKQNSFIESFNIKKKYPNAIKIKIFEKRPIAILVYKKEKFYLSENIDLIEFKNLPNFQNLPYVFGNKDKFKIFYKNLNEINFPFNQITKFTLYEINRWDLETINSKIIKLPSKNYIKSLKSYLELTKKHEFKKYKVFDYRINDQLILK